MVRKLNRGKTPRLWNTRLRSIREELRWAYLAPRKAQISTKTNKEVSLENVRCGLRHLMKLSTRNLRKSRFNKERKMLSFKRKLLRLPKFFRRK